MKKKDLRAEIERLNASVAELGRSYTDASQHNKFLARALMQTREEVQKLRDARDAARPNDSFAFLAGTMTAKPGYERSIFEDGGPPWLAPLPNPADIEAADKTPAGALHIGDKIFAELPIAYNFCPGCYALDGEPCKWNVPHGLFNCTRKREAADKPPVEVPTPNITCPGCNALDGEQCRFADAPHGPTNCKRKKTPARRMRT